MRYLSYECLLARSDLAGQRQSGVTALEAGMPLAVLAEIGGGALVAVIVRGAVIISEAAGSGAGSVIVEIADLVGERPVIVVMVTVVARFGPGRRDRRRQQQGGESEELQVGHLDSPRIPLKA